MHSPKQILFDAERMKYPHTGLYHFCLHLGNAILENADADKEKINLFIPQNEQSSFPINSKLLQLKYWHKVFLPSTKQIDAWHATHQDTQYFPFKKNIPTVLTIHDLNYLNDPLKSSSKKKSFYNDLKKKIETANHLTFISQFSLNDFKQHFNVENKPSTVIYNGCNIIEIENVLPPKNKPSNPFLFTIGTITEKKNFHVIPALLANTDYHLIIAGITQNEDYKQQIIKEAKRHRVENRIIFANAISENDKQWYYKNCEAFIFPSLAEGFGLPVIEAMYFGKPVFLSTATSLPEVGGNVAYYFSTFDAEDMQQTLALGLRDFKEKNMAKAVKERANQFSWQNAAIDYLNVYRSLY